MAPPHTGMRAALCDRPSPTRETPGVSLLQVENQTGRVQAPSPQASAYGHHPHHTAHMLPLQKALPPGGPRGGPTQSHRVGASDSCPRLKSPCHLPWNSHRLRSSARLPASPSELLCARATGGGQGSCSGRPVSSTRSLPT